MQNDRPIEDPRLQEALDIVKSVFRMYDLAGAVMLVNEHESAYAYNLYTTFNMVIEDASVQPLGFRFRVKTAEQGPERAEALVLGTGHMLHSLEDFGIQTQRWMHDLLQMLRRHGIRFAHQHFNGQRLPRLTNQPPP